MRKNSGRATYTAQEFAKKLGIGRNQLYEGIRRGEIPSFKIGRRIFIPRVAGDRLLEGKAA